MEQWDLGLPGVGPRLGVPEVGHNLGFPDEVPIMPRDLSIARPMTKFTQKNSKIS